MDFGGINPVILIATLMASAVPTCTALPLMPGPVWRRSGVAHWSGPPSNSAAELLPWWCTASGTPVVGVWIVIVWSTGRRCGSACPLALTRRFTQCTVIGTPLLACSVRPGKVGPVSWLA